MFYDLGVVLLKDGLSVGMIFNISIGSAKVLGIVVESGKFRAGGSNKADTGQGKEGSNIDESTLLSRLFQHRFCKMND